jgi:SAM-dependent methyltransferase
MEAALQNVERLIPATSEVVSLAPGLEDVFAAAGRPLRAITEDGGPTGEGLVAAVAQATAEGAQHLVVPGERLRWLVTQDALLEYLAENAVEVTWREEALGLFLLQPPDAETRELQRVRVVREISPNDDMYRGNAEGYFNLGRLGLQCLRRALQLAGRGEVNAILDLPSGHGRVLRFFRAAWPEAEIVACDLDRDGVDFCAATFGAKPVYSAVHPQDIPLSQQFDAIWVGSLVTHLEAPLWDDFLAFWAERLLPGGVLVFSFHGEHIIEACRAGQETLGIVDIQKLVSECDESGFAYEDYRGQDGYGIALSRSDWVRERIAATPGLKLLDIWPRGWSGWHDLAVVTTDPTRRPVPLSPRSPEGATTRQVRPSEPVVPHGRVYRSARVVWRWVPHRVRERLRP